MEKKTLERCRVLREQGRAFELGDNCWIDPEGQYAKDNSWVDEAWVLGRGPEWIVREADGCGVYASYKIEHAPTYFELTDLIAYVREDNVSL